jgi:hypothetical protein
MDPSRETPEPSTPHSGGGRENSSRGGGSARLALVLFFLSLAASQMVVQTAFELRQGQGIRALDIFRQKPTSRNLRNYEHDLEDASITARWLRPWFQFAQFFWLRDGGAKVLVGRDGWLFYRPGYDDMLTRSKAVGIGTNDPVRAILSWRDALAARGIRLMVLPVPNKESVYPDQLTRRVASGIGLVSPAARDLLTRLNLAGVECVDLFKVFAEARGGRNGAPLYLAQDSHWSPEGLAIAAKAVADRLVHLGWVEPRKVEYRASPKAIRRFGDVLEMLHLPQAETAERPEEIPCVQVIQNDSGNVYQDEVNAEVLVIGDSFLRIFQQDQPGAAGFIAHLAKELRQPLSSLVSDGGASTLVRQELFRRPALLTRKRVVVWEFVERDIHLGTEGWQWVPLPGQVNP